MKRRSKNAQRMFQDTLSDIAANYDGRLDRGVLTIEERKQTKSVQDRSGRAAVNSSGNSKTDRSGGRKKKRRTQLDSRKKRSEATSHHSGGRKKRRWTEKNYKKQREKTESAGERGVTQSSPKKPSKASSVSQQHDNAKHSARGQQRTLTQSIPWKLIGITATVLLLAAILFLVVRANTGESFQNQSLSSPQERVVTEQVLVPLNISPDLKDLRNRIGEEAAFTAYLQHRLLGDGQSGVHEWLAADDAGNIIRLSGLSSNQKELFARRSTTSEAFLITGSYKKGLTDITLGVDQILPYEREFIVQNRTVVEHVVTTDVLEVQDNRTILQRVSSIIFPVCEDATESGTCSDTKPFYCSRGELRANPEKCGCPESLRLYQDSCVEIIECRDGTLSPECSMNQPQLCDRGALVDAASVCGCPPDHREEGESCKKIQRCSDGTEYGTCSTQRPVKCEKGKLVDAAPECGCPSKTYEYEQTCLEKIAMMEKEIYRFTNQERIARGISPLIWHERLHTIARAHSDDMVSRSFYSHDNPDGEDPTARARRGGFKLHKELGGGWYSEGIAENINIMPTGNVQGIGYLADNPTDVARASVTSWMNSPSHRANILNSQYTHIGVGVARGQSGYYGTQNFW